MLEIVFLGTGSGVPTKFRNHAAIWVRYEGDCMLWDCGEGTQRQLLHAGLNFMKINRIFITHWHADHWAGLIGLIQSMNLESRKEPLVIYGPDAERFVDDILDLDYWGPRFKITGVDVPADTVEPVEVVKGEGYRVLAIGVKHTIPSVAYSLVEEDVVNVDIKKAERLYGLTTGPAVGMLKEKGKVVYKGQTIRLEDVSLTKHGVKVVYTGDTQPCANIEVLAREADVLIHDSTFEEDKEGYMHSGATQAAQMAKKAGAKSLVLTHFSRRYTSVRELVEQAQAIFPYTRAAKDFLKLELKRS